MCVYVDMCTCMHAYIYLCKYPQRPEVLDSPGAGVSDYALPDRSAGIELGYFCQSSLCSYLHSSLSISLQVSVVNLT